MKVLSMEQGSLEWLQARCGMIGASNFSKVLAGGSGKTRTDYMYKVAAERITGNAEASYSNSAMDWGTETEPEARAAYELFESVAVDQVGFIVLNDWVGCSPDGLVGDKGLVEIKCPNTTTQIKTFLSGEMPKTHTPQVQGQLFVCEREWTDFVSFDPRIKSGESQYFKKRVYRDDKYINGTLWPGLERFVNELQELLEKLK